MQKVKIKFFVNVMDLENNNIKWKPLNVIIVNIINWVTNVNVFMVNVINWVSMINFC
jgi:hypothetical protein